MMSDEDREFQRAVTEGLVPKLEGSAVAMVMVSPGEEIDAKFCTELGVMIMLDKPIIAIVMPGRTLSKKMELVADKIVHADITTPEGHEILTEALRDFGIGLDNETT